MKAKVEEDANELKKLKDRVQALEHEAGIHNYGLARQALEAERQYREALASVGASPKPLTGSPSIGAGEFFGWLREELKVLPTLMTMCSDYGAALVTEATFNLLERQGCNHYPALSDGRIQIDEGARAECSHAASKCSHQFCRQHWVKHGRGEAKEKARRLLVPTS